MSRADVERSLEIERDSQNRNRFWAGAFATYVTAELTFIGAALINEVGTNQPIGLNNDASSILLLTGLPAVYGIVRNTLDSMSHANTAAALEGVLAASDLQTPEVTTETHIPPSAE